jgi:hypothetical protein
MMKLISIIYTVSRFNLVRSAIAISLLVTLLPHSASAGRSPNYLSGGEVAGIGGSALAVAGFGKWVRDIGTKNRRAAWDSPISLELSLHRFLAGDCAATKSNFLDNDLGSAATSAGAFVLLTTANLSWPQYDENKYALQDAFLFTTGVVATKGVTDLFKGIVARQRPMACLYPDIAAQRDKINPQHDRQSFFSGHASAAFFSATYLNLRVRTIMRQRMSAEDYRSYRWSSPLVTFGWATFVGWTRIHAYQHFPSDVLAGALAGYLMGELFFSFSDKLPRSDGSSSSTPLLKITLNF